MILHLFRSVGRSLEPLPQRPGQSKGWKGQLAEILAGSLAVAFAAVLGLAGEAQALEGPGEADVSLTTSTTPGPARHPREKTYLKRTWGVEPMYVRQSAAGYMLEFRYKVLDAEKAKPLFERQTKPVLTHTESGARLIVPTPATTGALRNSNPPLDDHIYWMFFANPGKLVQPGDHVNIDIGEFRVAGLIVQ
jgi:hypothetical protein